MRKTRHLPFRDGAGSGEKGTRREGFRKVRVQGEDFAAVRGTALWKETPTKGD